MSFLLQQRASAARVFSICNRHRWPVVSGAAIVDTAIGGCSGWRGGPSQLKNETAEGHRQHQTRGHRSGHHDDGGTPGRFSERETGCRDQWTNRDWTERAFTVGIGGPVGSGKTALVLRLVQALRDEMPGRLGVVTNDIFTQEDAEFLVRAKALPSDRIVAVETGGCPHAAIREDVTANLGALEGLTRRIAAETGGAAQSLLLCESGGDNLAANFSRELADFTIYVIDVAGGDKVPRKGGPGITQSDVLVINKTDLAEAVGADLGVMKRDAVKMRSGGGHRARGTSDAAGPIVFAAVRHGEGVSEIRDLILQNFQIATGSGN